MLQIRNCFQQRSRWTKGHFQIAFNPARTPLLQWRLPLFHRFMYMSGVWCYAVGAITTPLFMVIPLVTVWVGYFPLVICREFALALTLYAAATQAHGGEGAVECVARCTRLPAAWAPRGPHTHQAAQPCLLPRTPFPSSFRPPALSHVEVVWHPHPNHGPSHHCMRTPAPAPTPTSSPQP